MYICTCKPKHRHTMRLKTNLPMYVFTSQIPTLDFAEVGIDPVSVTVWAGRDKLLETTMYPVYGHIRLYDLGDLYEEYLRSQDGEDIYPYAILEIDIDNHVWEDNMIIYCPYHCNLTALEFINKHFLTTLSTKRVPADATRDDEILAYLLTSEEAATTRTIEVTAAFRTPDGNIVGHTCSYSDNSRYQYDGLLSSPVELDVLFDHYCEEQCDYDWRDLVPLSYTFRLGQRTFTYYVDQDFKPSVRFRFRNAFDAEETIYLEAVTVTKTDTERSLATSHGVSLFYDQVDSQEYEVTTAPLSSEEAAWATQLLLSHKVQRVEDDGTLTDVLVVDMTAEVTDSDEEHRRLKFTYRLAKQGASLKVSGEANGNSRFANQFTIHFA